MYANKKNTWRDGGWGYIAYGVLEYGGGATGENKTHRGEGA